MNPDNDRTTRTVIGKEPFVSVCIPTYNRAGMLRESIESVLAQTYKNFELIVVDNASEDETEFVVRRFEDPRIVYTRNSRNIGGWGNWNRCLTLSRGLYIAILPDDDLMMPKNLERKIEVLQNNEKVGLVHSKYHLIDGQGRITRHNTNWGHGPDRDQNVIERGLDVLERMLLTFNLINAPTVVFRRACFEKLGGFAPELKLAFDWEYWMRIAAFYDVAFLAEPLIKWRIHGGSLTSQLVIGEQNSTTATGFLEEIGARWLMLRKHPGKLSYRNHLRKRIQWKAIDGFQTRIDEMLGAGRPNQKAKRFVLEMCRAFPPVITDKLIWKAFLKSVLSRSSIERLKRICPI